jgi:hypothetical protein
MDSKIAQATTAFFMKTSHFFQKRFLYGAFFAIIAKVFSQIKKEGLKK